VRFGDQALVEHLLVLGELRDRIGRSGLGGRRLLRCRLLGACCWGACCCGACWPGGDQGWAWPTMPPAAPMPAPNIASPAPPPFSPAACTPRAAAWFMKDCERAPESASAFCTSLSSSRLCW